MDIIKQKLARKLPKNFVVVQFEKHFIAGYVIRSKNIILDMRYFRNSKDHIQLYETYDQAVAYCCLYREQMKQQMEDAEQLPLI